jgi:hypothetical protein
MRRIRKMVDDTAKQRGRPLYLHTRVLPDIQVCYNRGMDVETWVNEGLVDAITPGCGYMTFTQNLAPWVQLVAGKPCWIYPGNNHWKTPEVTRAWAKLMMQRGADGLYLFNWGHLLYGFDKNSSTKSERLGTVWYDEVHPRYYEVLNQIGVLKTMAFEDTVYNLESIPHEAMAGEAGGNHRRYRAIEPIELPIQLPRGQHCFNLPFAEDLQAARQVGFTPQLTLRFKLSNYTHPDQFDVSINSQRLDPNTRTERAVFIMANDTWFAYPLADSFLNRGNNAVVIDVHKLNPQMSVTPMLQNVELIVKYRPS